MVYDAHHDLKMRLLDSIVLYEKKAHVVVEAREDLRIRLRSLTEDKHVVVSQTSKHLNIRNLMLGYSSLEGRACYLVRRPDRQWKQGIHPRTVVPISRGFRGPVSNSAIGQCLEGHYLTLEKALKALEGGTNPFLINKVDSVPFSRNWAIGQEDTLFYKGRAVGKYGDKPMLEDRYGWLIESLEETLDAHR